MSKRTEAPSEATAPKASLGRHIPAHKAWQGRLPGATEPLLEQFTTSLPSDLRLARYDVAGSLAHAGALARAGLLDAKALHAIERGLAKVGRELTQGRFQIQPGDEDIHMAVERRLTELAGEPGQRLHDQVSAVAAGRRVQRGLGLCGGRAEFQVVVVRHFARASAIWRDMIVVSS